MKTNVLKNIRFDSIIANYWTIKMVELKSQFLLALEANGISQKKVDFTWIEDQYFVDFRTRMTSLWQKKKSNILDKLPINATQGRVEHECYLQFYNIIYPEYEEFLASFLKSYFNDQEK